MHTIKEEPENLDTDEESLPKEKLRESLSTVEPNGNFRALGSGWMECATSSGRLYYWNSETKEKSWKPPRKKSDETEKTLPNRFSLPLDFQPSEEYKFSSTANCEAPLPWSIDGNDNETTNVGKILRMGVLKTTEIGIKGKKIKKNWVKSFVVLTEFYVLFTTIVGSFKKLFKKTKQPNPSKVYLMHAELTKDTKASNRHNVYRLKTVCKDILFRSNNPTVAESWYQAMGLVINNLKNLENPQQFDFCEQLRTNSFDLKETFSERFRRSRSLITSKSISMSDFDIEDMAPVTPRTRCLSDFLGVKHPTPPGWISIYDSETKQFCYVNCITQKKWFWAISEDGHPYFYEEGLGRRSWVLPSIYLDVNSQSLEEIRKSIGSRRSLKIDV